MANSLRTVDPVEQALDALRYLANQCISRPLIHELVVRDMERWAGLNDGEKRIAFQRAFRRVGAVCPWVRSKKRIAEAASALGFSTDGLKNRNEATNNFSVRAW